MKRNNLLLLAAVIAVAAAALVVSRDPAPTTTAMDEGVLYPGLEAVVNEIDQVVVLGPKDARVTLSRDGEGWRVEPPGGFPADVSRLRELLLSLAQAKLIEAKTAKAEFYDRLGLQGLAAEDSPTRRVQLSRGGELLYDVWIGERRQGESFVRREGEAQTWLVTGRIEASSASADWLARDLIDVPSERIRSVAVQPATADAYRIERGEAGADFVMPQMPEGVTLKSSAVRRLAGTLARLRLTDVVRDDQRAHADGQSLRFETFDGLAVEARLFKVSDKFHLRLQVGNAEPAADTSEEQRQAVAAEVERLSAALSGWEFELGDYDGGSFALLRADLLENKAAE